MTKDYKVLFQEALRASDLDTAGTVALEAFAEVPNNEELLEWMAGNVFERGIENAMTVVPTFVDRFPDSVGLPRIFMAQMLEKSEPDSATHFARHYLRLLKEQGALEKLDQFKILRTGATRAFLILPSVYRAVGALSYCTRVLKYAQSFQVEDASRDFFKEDLETCQSLLQDPKMKTLDQQWEDFFTNGVNADFCLQICKEVKFEILAKRLELLETQFRFDSHYKPTDHEFLQEVGQTKDGAFILF